jgi:hypothetical protein
MGKFGVGDAVHEDYKPKAILPRYKETLALYEAQKRQTKAVRIAV